MNKEPLSKQNKLLVSILVLIVIASSLIIVLAAVNPLHNAYSINPTNPTNDVIKGSISSISNDPTNSSTQWISTGVYKMENVRTTSPTFNSTFYMIKTDGTAKHTHSIYDFKLNADPIVNTSNNSTILNGTSTVTMKEKPVNDVPTQITLLGNSVISILLEPTKINNHFGNTPIYGNQHLICIEIPSLCK
jgi:hypothetical protein